MKKHINIIITAVASLLIVTLAGREFIKNHKKESNDKSSTNVSENTCEDIPDTSIPDTSISDTSVADTNTPEADILDTTYENNKEQFYISEIPDNIFEKMQGKSYKADSNRRGYVGSTYAYISLLKQTSFNPDSNKTLTPARALLF